MQTRALKPQILFTRQKTIFLSIVKNNNILAR